MLLDVMKLFPKMFFGWGGGGDEGGGSAVSSIETRNDIQQLPDYPEATGARENWWSTLQKWQTEPGYGSIQPDWNSIWENARGKVSRYFGGGPEGPGLDSKVKAGLARRGMSENPASDALLQRSGFQQGNLLQDLAVKQATEQAQLGEKGRTTWLSSLMQLAGLKPQFSNFGTTAVTSMPSSGGEGAAATGGMIGAGLFDNFLGGQDTGGGGLDGIMSLFGTGGADTDIGDLYADNSGQSWDSMFGGDMSFGY